MPTIQNRFGASTTLNNGILTIDLSDYSTESLDNPNTLTSNDADKILAAIIQKNINWELTLPVGTQTHNVSLQKQSFNFIQLETRNNLVKRNYSYTANIYVTDTGANDPDPNDV
jgi:hypothetical protein